MQVHSFGHHGRVSRPFTQDVPVGCAEVILRAIVPLKMVPAEIQLDEYVRSTPPTGSGTLVDEQHLVNGRSASLDFRGLVGGRFTIAEVKQRKTTNSGMRAVYFRLIRNAEPMAVDSVITNFFVKLSCSQWADAKIYSNPPLRNETGETVVRENVTVNVLKMLGDEHATRVFKFVVSDAATAAAFVKSAAKPLAKEKTLPLPQKEEVPLLGAMGAALLRVHVSK